MPVVISPNIKKESVRIDPSGNIINPKTRQIIQPVEPEEMQSEVIPTPIMPAKTSKIDEMISRKIEEIINRKITEALEKL